MKTPTQLRLLASTNNARGDLFTRLVGDLFFALGYDNLRFDVHKSGREIDIQGTHRLEPRRLVAECKAQADKIGGADLNKFFGVVNRERSKDKQTPVTGYFVSLSGFRETGIEQEDETDEQERSILLDGSQVIEELIRIRILISHAHAAERAGRCAKHSELKDAVPDGAELLGHQLGYLWAVFYSQGKQRTHFALIHADGTALAKPVAQEVIQADRECGGSLHKLAYLSPPAPAPDREALAKRAVERYRKWIVTECGDIQLDGLPADADLSAFRMRLERLFCCWAAPLRRCRRWTCGRAPSWPGGARGCIPAWPFCRRVTRRSATTTRATVISSIPGSTAANGTTPPSTARGTWGRTPAWRYCHPATRLSVTSTSPTST